jgi:hypothetical protein
VRPAPASALYCIRLRALCRQRLTEPLPLASAGPTDAPSTQQHKQQAGAFATLAALEARRGGAARRRRRRLSHHDVCANSMEAPWRKRSLAGSDGGQSRPDRGTEPAVTVAGGIRRPEPQAGAALAECCARRRLRRQPLRRGLYHWLQEWRRLAHRSHRKRRE